MKDFLIIIKKYLTPFKSYACLNILFNALGVIFSLFSIVLIIPFLGILFETDATLGVGELTKIPFEFKKEVIENIFKYKINYMIENSGKVNTLVFVSILVLIMFFLKNLFIYFANFFMAPIRNGVVKNIRNNIYDKILKLPLGYFSNERKGDIISRMTSDVQEVEWSIMSSLEMMFREPLNIIIFLTGLFILSPSLTLFVLVLLPVGGFIIGRIGRSLRKISSKGQSKMGELLSMIEETLSGMRIIKAFNAEEKINSRFNKENNKYFNIMNTMVRRRYLASPLSEFLGSVIVMTIMWYGGKLVLGGESDLSAETFIGYVALFSQILNPAKALSTAFYNVQKGLASIDRIDKILDSKIKIIENDNPKAIKSFNDKIEYKNVNFKYKTEYVLKDINLTLFKGNTIALVGQSGSGKSTFVDLLPRFYDIQGGEILVDGIPITDLKLHDLRGLMGNVNQESILFNDTFFNNISFGVDNASKEDVEAAAKVANAHDFIMESENGYETNIGDRGSKMSGGQRQRISIARAVLKNPPILILDEATSALDTESERLVQDALENLMKNRTSIVIAHRLSTVKNADEICVFHKGKIVERGKHSELIRKEGAYKKLHDLQMF
ncbi:ABC transporter ATP-binding protein [Bacteroidota bacterium]